MATEAMSERNATAGGQPQQARVEVARVEGALGAGASIVVEVRGAENAGEVAKRALAAATIEAMRPIPAKHAAAPGDSYAGIVGRSASMKDLYRLLERIKSSNATILISGENGTGKELVARAIHDLSSRGSKRFVATNCSAFNDNLLESELFGHKRGSFTGAVVDKPGLFEVADGGTFFLDEVGDMSPALQVKLLRVLQEGIFMPVGATEPRKVDVRIIAATNRELGAMVQHGQFREDLYYRLHVVALRVPALRDRADDIPLLVGHFLARLAARDGRKKALSQAAMQRLLDHRWPGNVRELENEIERLWVLSGDDALVGEETLSPSIGRGPVEASAAASGAASASPAERAGTQNLPNAVEALERQMIVDGLRRARGNKTRAAEDLGISRRNLIRKVHAYRIDDQAWRANRGGAGGAGPGRPES